jgi:hypothetical protein
MQPNELEQLSSQSTVFTFFPRKKVTKKSFRNRNAHDNISSKLITVTIFESKRSPRLRCSIVRLPHRAIDFDSSLTG